MTTSGEPLSFSELVDRVRQGDQAAISELVTNYEADVRLVARARLGPALRPYIDSVDLLQSVHKSLLAGLRQDRFDISTREKLLALTMTIVRRKAAQCWRRVRRQQRINSDHGSQDGLLDILCSLTDVDPHNAVSHRDVLRHLLDDMKETERSLVRLRLDGYTTAEAATKLGLSQSASRVCLHRLRKRLRGHAMLAHLL